MKKFRRMIGTLALLAGLAVALSGAPQSERLADGRGGAFDVTRHSIRLEEIQSGGPNKCICLTHRIVQPGSLDNAAPRGGAVWRAGARCCAERVPGWPCAQGAEWLSFPYIFIFCGMCGACECLKTLGEPPRS